MGKFGLGVQNEAGQRLTGFGQENSLAIANTHFQEQKDNCTYGYHQMVNTEIRLILFFADKDEEALYSQSQGTYYGSDHELLIAKFGLKLKKVGKNH